MNCYNILEDTVSIIVLAELKVNPLCSEVVTTLNIDLYVYLLITIVIRDTIKAIQKK